MYEVIEAYFNWLFTAGLFVDIVAFCAGIIGPAGALLCLVGICTQFLLDIVFEEDSPKLLKLDGERDWNRNTDMVAGRYNPYNDKVHWKIRDPSLPKECVTYAHLGLGIPICLLSGFLGGVIISCLITLGLMFTGLFVAVGLIIGTVMLSRYVVRLNRSFRKHLKDLHKMAEGAESYGQTNKVS
jgi:hypothetical protein